MSSSTRALLEALRVGRSPAGAQPDDALQARDWLRERLQAAPAAELRGLFTAAERDGPGLSTLLRWVEACVPPGPDSAAIYRRLGQYLPEQADLAATYNLGRTLRDSCGEPAAAQRLFERCTERFMDDADSWLELGNARADLGDHPGARAAWARCAALEPMDPGPWLNMGQLHKERQEWAEACEAMAECCARTQQAEEWHVYGHVLQAAGRAEEGARALKRAIDAYLDRPPDDGTLFWTGAAWARLGRVDEALSCLETALRGDPSLAADARDEEDFAALRGVARFRELVGG